jgi:hypothetical protein
MGVVLTQLVLLLDSRNRANKTNDKIDVVGENADTAATEAASAAKRAFPVSNGFADDVRDGISEIKDTQTEQGKELHEVHRKLDEHIADHARSDVLRRNQ